jgi:hypothetical protein
MMRRLLLLPLLCSIFLGLTGPAQADFGFKDLAVEFQESNGDPARQAGSHPYSMTTTIDMNTVVDPELGVIPDQEARDLVVELPPGFVGDPEAVPYCPTALFRTTLKGGYSACPDEATIGTIYLRLEAKDLEEPKEEWRKFPVFNLPPTPGSAARIGFLGFSVPVTMAVGVEEAPPYNLVTRLADIPQTAPFYGADLVLWGNPADPVHDPERGGCLDIGLGTPPPRQDCSVDLPQRPFLTMPRTCSESFTTLFKARSWQVEDRWVEETAETPSMEGCDNLPPFDAKIATNPDTESAAAPTALDFSIDIEDQGLTDPAKIAQSDIKATKVTLPAGVTVNPSQAEALAACSPADFAREKAGTFLGEGCPSGSRIGTVEVETPLLRSKILRGNVFVASPGDNPFGTLLALYMTINEPDMGIHIGLAGKVEPIESGPNAGQIVATFDDLPQLPFSHFRFHFRGGPRSALSTPARCGTYTTEAVFTPWADPSDTFTTTANFEVTKGVDGGSCPTGALPFDPGFSAGTVTNRAGSYSPFLMRVTKGDGQQEITRFDSILPPGVTGKIAGVPQCSDAALAAAKGRSGKEELATPSCPAASRLGSVLAGSGVGSALTYVSGTIYLAGPYAGSPLSVAVITPAVAGPFDLGTVVIREGLNLNPITAEVEVAGSLVEPIPTFLEGIPLKLRDLRIMIDRDRFTLNATGCDVKTVRADIFGSSSDLTSTADDAAVARTTPYRASNCGALAFKPKLKLQLTGSTKRSGHPSLHSLLTPRLGEANIGKAVVTLPPSEQIDNAHINNPCTRVQFNADQCPPLSVLGVARAFTPLLDQPLEGPVYFRSNGGERELPDIVADLKGQFEIVLVGFIDSKNGRIRTTFANVPDAPVSKFVLQLYGGKRGLLVNNRNLCRQKLRSKLVLTGQNARISKTSPILKTSCKSKSKGKAKTAR